MSKCQLEITNLTLSGSYVSRLFNRSKPASDRIGRPEKDAAGNLSLSLLYLRGQKKSQYCQTKKCTQQNNKRKGINVETLTVV
jgi:hypothetical protein